MALEPVVISLRRATSDKSWGFVLQGGVDQGLPVFVHKVSQYIFLHFEECIFLIDCCQMTGDNQRNDMNSGFELIHSRYQDVFSLLKELMVITEFKPMSPSFTIKDYQ